MNENIKYRYDPCMDCLHLASLQPGKGKYTGGWSINDDQRMGLTADITTEGRCIGIEFWHAAELLLPHLLPNQFQPSGIKTALKVEYNQETDMLHIHNGRIGDYREVIVQGWIAHYDTAAIDQDFPVGEIVGITLENAAQEILPDLLQYHSGQFWGDDKAERMRRFRINQPASSPAGAYNPIAGQ